MTAHVIPIACNEWQLESTLTAWADYVVEGLEGRGVCLSQRSGERTAHGRHRALRSIERRHGLKGSIHGDALGRLAQRAPT